MIRLLAAVANFFYGVCVAFAGSDEQWQRFDVERDVHHFHRTPDVISLNQMYRKLHFDLWEKELT